MANTKTVSTAKSFDVLFDMTFHGVRDGQLSRVMRSGLLNKRLPIIAPPRELTTNEYREVSKHHHYDHYVGMLMLNSVEATTEDGIRLVGRLTPFGAGASLFTEAVKNNTLLDSITGLYGFWGNTDNKFVTVLGLESSLAR